MKRAKVLRALEHLLLLHHSIKITSRLQRYRLRYRVSAKGVANHPEEICWSSALFGPVLNHLPGVSLSSSVFEQLTYARFVAAENDLLLGFRIGK